MEQSLGLWVTPLLLIPGMALLAISTSGRYTQLLLYVATNPKQSGLKRQLPLLRYALIAIYTGIAFDAAAALLGHLFASDADLSRLLLLVLSCIGVICLIFAAVCLVIDTSHSELRHIE
jgi:hypothetical protein